MSKSSNYYFFIFKLAAVIYLFLCVVFSYADAEFVYDSKGKRDPFNPLVTPDGRLLKIEENLDNKDLVLEGIIYDENGLSYAIVNSLVVKVGDIIGDYEVLKVEKNKIIFINQGQISEIKIKKEEE